MNIRLSEAPRKTASPVPDPVLFGFDGPSGRIQGRGPARRIAAGNAATLEARVAAALAGVAPDAVIGGALPFDREAGDCLWHCRRSEASAPGGAALQGLPLPGWRLTAEPAARDYAGAVARALGIMAEEAGSRDALEKIVLARTLLVESAAPIPVEALMARLHADRSVTAFRVALPAGPEHPQGRALCGATPELLVEKRGRTIASHPLAGSARRLADPVADHAAAAALSGSAKDHREHALVVEAILDTLAPWCRELGCPQGTCVTSTRSMWHLGTRIEGRLKDADTPSVVLASALHPTPAVCGVPMGRAAGFIKALEPVARDFYAGAVGWCDASGDGAWYVAIRCAEISGRQARLYAGAGIVPGSDPMAEAAETGAKFGALLAALGLPQDAALQGVACNGDT
ncbi:isochorismate synthase [Paracoccus pantotrophus]|uniref:isochorismate synthase n=2 Tax=Paracoccaceae TaxID=31989 RepID=A0AAE6NY76_PARPN|nr:isochorismate synthase [Paracoccus pantotrophus]RDD94333.1 isochorismate synthase [Paracoccus pantotrophus]RKS51308.1 isochorismate synthase [Paracoccus pantotrophus]RNI19808.1 isochorismate synthase [Paracoccus pantotrophus]WGR65736.1 isochorismate synthase [Paracoccus pantotrophus]